MAFFDKLNQMAKNLGDKTSDAIEITKFNSKISAEKGAAETELKKAGEFYYQIYLAGGEVAPDVVEFFQNAKAHYEIAAEAQAEIDRIKAENEAEKIDQAAQTAQATAQAPAAPVKITCISCGAELAEGVKFCGECGTRQEA